MKKLIIALIAFLIILGACIFEIVFTTDTYASLEKLSVTVTENGAECVKYKKENELSLSTLNSESEQAKHGLAAASRSTYESIEALNNYWIKRRTFTLTLGNHTVVKSIEERIATLQRQWHTEQWEDLTVTSDALSSYFRGLKDDTHPTLPNLI